MDKAEYYKISKKEGFPKRCPILNRCLRRAYTIYFFSYQDDFGSNQNIVDLLIREHELYEDFKDEMIKLQGEEPSVMKGTGKKGYISFKHFCPEVTLFDDENRPFCVPAQPIISGAFGFEAEGEPEFAHFSECSEFGKNHYDSSIKSKKARKPKRIPLSKKMRFEILQRDKYKCQYCGSTQEDGAKLQIDHIVPVSEGGRTILITYTKKKLKSRIARHCERPSGARQSLLDADCRVGKASPFDPLRLRSGLSAGSGP